MDARCSLVRGWLGAILVAVLLDVDLSFFVIPCHPVLSTVVTREALGNLCPIIIRKADTLLGKWFEKGIEAFT